MDAGAALEQLRAKLESTFGRGMAMMILASASNASGVPTLGITESDFLKLAEEVARDQRVIDMWGAAGAADVLTQWRQLV